MRIRPRRRPAAALLLGVLAPLANGQLTPIPVANPSFESPSIASGTFSTTSAPPGWQVFGQGIDFGNRTIGVLNPATTTLYTSPVPDGDNVGVVFLLDDPGQQTVFAGIEAGMQQTLPTLLQLGTRYTLTLEVGNIANDASPPHNNFEFAGFPGYRVELTAGGIPLAVDDDSLLPAEGGFLTSVIEVTTGAAHAQAGQPLGIRLVNLNAAPGLEVNFDDVRLMAEPCGPLASSETVRLGSPPNPAALLPGQTSGPAIGATWDPLIDHAAFAPTAVIDVLVVTALPANQPSPLGTVLCDVSAPPLLFAGTPGVAFALPIPSSCGLVGGALCAQGASVDAGGIQLTNALDVVLGTF